eukprot:scaffold1849_cov115-Cylindrotheca_fusiformis.AAC.11
MTNSTPRRVYPSINNKQQPHDNDHDNSNDVDPIQLHIRDGLTIELFSHGSNASIQNSTI